MKPPAEVFYVDASFSPASRYRRRSAGVGGGRLAKLEYALARRAACPSFDPAAKVDIYRSETTWVKVDA